MDLDGVLASLEADGQLWEDFNALCDCGGRQAGSASEARALHFARDRVASIHSSAYTERIEYQGWQLERASLSLEDGTALACHALLGSQSTSPDGLNGEICDLGRGSEADFARCASALKGRIALVRHEYMFGTETIHRRRKLAWAMEAGAIGFIIAHPAPGEGPVSGSSGRAGGAGIPAVATDFESAARLAMRGSAHARVRLLVQGDDCNSSTDLIALDLPGRTDQWIVVSAHLDGHALGESAMDNATGVAAALAVVRALAPHAALCARGVRLCLFSAEEWALAGSKQYLDHMAPARRDAIALNINLDTVAGDARLTALTSDFPRLGPFIDAVAREAGVTVGTHLPTMPNSDHYNFARHGIPALRLVAGFNQSASLVRHVLTRNDLRHTVERRDLVAATRFATRLAWRALTMDEHALAALRAR